MTSFILLLSDFPAHSMFTSDVCWGSLGTSTLGTQVQPQVILDPDYLPDYLSVSYDYGPTQRFFLKRRVLSLIMKTKKNFK